jgi:hypothetical protein
MKRALSSSETSVLTRATWGNIPEDTILNAAIFSVSGSVCTIFFPKIFPLSDVVISWEALGRTVQSHHRSLFSGSYLSIMDGNLATHTQMVSLFTSLDLPQSSLNTI